MISIFYRLFLLFLTFFCSGVVFPQNVKTNILLKEELVINDDAIGKINGIQTDSKNQVYVSDGINQCIHLFSSNGKYLRKIGRQGKAPGEYQYIWGIQITNGDTLVVYDGVQYRLTIYSPGKFNSPLKTLKLPTLDNQTDRPGVIGNSYSGMSGLWLPQNNCRLFLIIYNSPYSSNDLKQKHYSKLYLVDYKGKFTKKEPVLKIQDVERLRISSGGNFMVSEMPFGRRPVISLSKEGNIYYAETDNFNIKSVNLDGKRKSELNYKTDKIFITDKLWESELNNYSSLTHKDLSKSGTAIPEYLPFIENITNDQNGNLWVASNQADYKSYKYYIFNKQGKLLNTIQVPDKTVIRIIDKYYAYGIRTDEWGLQSVVKYKIETK